MNIKYKKDLNGINLLMLQGFCHRWKTPLTPNQLFSILENSYKFVLAIDDESRKVIGFVNAISDKIQFAFIPMLEVLPKFQHAGIGSNLMTKLLDELGEIDCIDLTCDIKLQDFYSRFDMLKSNGMVIRRYLSPSKNN